MKWQDFQKRLFDLIESRFLTKKEMIFNLCEVLSIEVTSAYQRVNLSQKLSLPDVLTLIEHYHLSAQLMMGIWNTAVIIKFQSLVSNPSSFGDYIDPLLQKMQLLGTLPDARVHYAANELPFYHFFAYQEIALFKYYMWRRVAWTNFEDRSIPLTFEWIQNESHTCKEKIQAIHQAYRSFSSVEIWHTNVLFNTLNQIKYLHDIGLLPDKSLITLFADQLEAIVRSLMDEASRGTKDTDGVYSFQLYHNEVAHTNNIAVIQTSFGNQVLFAYDNPNIMETDDNRLCDYTLQYLSRLIQHSENLTASSERNRARCFSMMMKQIETLRATI